ncbi:MAG: hypothetical protein GF398_18195 [Chitinivibrionales bacterium]|nr:hypothetical protein [Chitinivibrionales bacterium]
MDERRRLERIKTLYYLRVYDSDSGHYVGSVSDISAKGMRLLSENGFDSDDNHKFLIKLPQGSIFGESITIGVQKRWAKCNEAEATHETGFEFDKKIDDGILAVRSLITDLKNKKLL